LQDVECFNSGFNGNQTGLRYFELLELALRILVTYSNAPYWRKQSKLVIEQKTFD